MPWRRIASAPTAKPRTAAASRAGEDRELGREAPDLGGVAGDVAGRAEEGGVAEGEQADIADQEVERAGEEREAQHVHQEDGVDRERGQGEGQDHDRERDPAVGLGAVGLAPAVSAAAVSPIASPSQLALPNRPAGLIRSTIAMRTKITVFEASG